MSFEVCQKPKSNLMSYKILVQDFKMPNFVDQYKTIFSGKARESLRRSKNLLLISEFPKNLF